MPSKKFGRSLHEVACDPAQERRPLTGSVLAQLLHLQHLQFHEEAELYRMSRRSPPLLWSSLSSSESERPVHCRMAIHLPHRVRLHLRDTENVRCLRIQYHDSEYEVQGINIPSTGASSQVGSSSLPKVSLLISISGHISKA